MDSDLPFSAEYAPSGRSTCKECKKKIELNSLRISKNVQDTKHDGKMSLWYHLDCFFSKKRVLRRISLIANFDNLRWNDQEKIRKKLVDKYSDDESSSSGSTSQFNSDFSVEYAKSSESVCRSCLHTIIKGKICISKALCDPALSHAGHSLKWYHTDCFIQNQQQIGFFHSAEKISGFTELSAVDQEILKKGIVSHNVMEAENPNDELSKKLKEQNILFFKMKERYVKPLSKDEIEKTLKHNGQYVYKRKLSKRLDLLADCLTFGALKNCPECKKNALIFEKNKYVCSGASSPWAKCEYQTISPERKKFVIPEELQAKFQGYESVVKKRMLPTTEDDLYIKLPLATRKIVLLGNHPIYVKKQLGDLGASVIKTVTDEVDLCIIPKNEEDSTMSDIKKAQAKNKKVDVVSEDFLTDIRGGCSLFEAVQKNILYPGVENLLLKYGRNLKRDKQKAEAKRQQRFTKGLPEKDTIIVKGAAAVYAKEYQKTSHVYKRGEEVYNAVLAYVDTFTNRNSFYILQLLKSDLESRYYLLRRWGRLRTIIDHHTIQDFDDVKEAIDAFEKFYLDKTRNEWKNRGNFRKKYFGYYPEEIDYGLDSVEVQEKLKAGENSRLSKPVQDLICLISNKEVMEMTMIEFEIDLRKMPLGKICKSQIFKAYGVLRKALQILEGYNDESKIKDITNCFFTLIPHDFGMKRQPLLDNKEIIYAKSEMLDSLLQIEFAYKILTQVNQDSQEPSHDHILEYYEKLKTDIEVIEKSTEEYLMIEKYLKNTTDVLINVELREVFRVSRNGESENYSKYKDLPNKKLLWHGSTIINFASILANGLQIAPPEAIHSGSSLGKGVYFADTVTKSYPYCKNPNGICLLLLCEVALGNIHRFEKTPANFVELPAGNSAWGMGRKIPDGKENLNLGRTEVPYGKLIKNTDRKCRFPYNEYAVYDTDQINIKYLVVAKFETISEPG